MIELVREAREIERTVQAFIRNTRAGPILTEYGRPREAGFTLYQIRGEGMFDDP